jgi:hypothetical protein
MSIDEDETRRGRRHVFLLRCPIEEEEVLRPESALLLRAPTAATPAGEEEEEEVENIIFSLSLSVFECVV